MKYLSFLAFLTLLSIASTYENAQVSGQPEKRTAQIRKADLVIKAPASKIYDILSTKLPLLSTIFPDIVRSVDLLQGRWGNDSCVILWKLNYEGKVAVAKAIMEVIDKENNRIVYKTIEGGPLDYYKSFSWIYEALPNEKVVRWTLEYETDNKVVPEPIAYPDWLTSMMERIEAYLIEP